MCVLCLRGAACSVVLHPVGLLRYQSPSAFSVQCKAISFILNLSFSQAVSKCNVETGGKERERNSRPCRECDLQRWEEKAGLEKQPRLKCSHSLVVEATEKIMSKQGKGKKVFTPLVWKPEQCFKSLEKGGSKEWLTWFGCLQKSKFRRTWTAFWEPSAKTQVPEKVMKKVSDSVLLPWVHGCWTLFHSGRRCQSGLPAKGGFLEGGQGEGRKCQGAGRLQKKERIQGQSAIVKWVAGSERSHILQDKPGREVQRQILS